MSHKAPKFIVGERFRITNYTNIKGNTENWSREVFVIDTVLKTKPWTYKIKDVNREKITKSSYEKELFQAKL